MERPRLFSTSGPDVRADFLLPLQQGQRGKRRKWSKSRSLRPRREFPGTDDIDGTSRNVKLRDGRDGAGEQRERETKRRTRYRTRIYIGALSLCIAMCSAVSSPWYANCTTITRVPTAVHKSANVVKNRRPALDGRKEWWPYASFGPLIYRPKLTGPNKL